jgi:predicted transcriptional regulator
MPAARRSKAAKAAPVEVEIDETEDFELEDDDEVEETPAPKAAKAKPAKVSAPKIEFGTKELAEHVNKEAGTSYDAYNLRILLRKLTKDGVLERVESEGRSRYSFTGPTDPQVVAIVAAVKDGAADKAKQERLDKLKADRATKKAATPKKGKAAKTAEVEPEADEEDDFETEDI